MGIAIRRDACEEDLKRLVEHYEREGRTRIGVSCPESDCDQQYVVYFNPPANEAEVHDGFLTYLRRDHPNHPPLYEIDESIPNP